MLHQVRRLAIQGAKNESAVSFKARNSGEVIALDLEAGAVGVVARHGNALSAVAVSPSVIAAGEIARRALALTANGRATMRASVHQRVDLAASVAGQDDRPEAKSARDEIIGLADFAFVAKIDPRATENPDQLLGKDRGIGVERAMHSAVLHQVIPSRRRVVHTSQAITRSIRPRQQDWTRPPTPARPPLLKAGASRARRQASPPGKEAGPRCTFVAV